MERSEFLAQLEHIVTALDEQDVNYSLIGGGAVGMLGHFRMSTLSDGSETTKLDFDFWYRPSLDNFFAVLRAADTLDFLPEAQQALSFREAFARAELHEVGDVDVFTVCYADLIAFKTATDRPKDREDIAALRRLHEGGNEG